MNRHFLALLTCLFLVEPAAAQMVLPGAVPATPAGTKERPPDLSGKPAKPKAAAFRSAATVDSIAGKTLWLNGGAGQMVFARKDKSLVVTALQIGGDQVSRPGEDCRVNVKPAEPMQAKPSGAEDGVPHYTLDLPTCPIEFEILDGAILVPKGAPACTFKDADCKVNPQGMWGPPPSQFPPEKVKELEHSRTSAETAMQEDFRALMARTTDKAQIKKVASEQAAFSSQREETCRSYVGEAQHGFCAARFTEARVLGLQALLGEPNPTATPPKKKHPAKPPRSSVSQEPPPPDAATPN